MRRVLVTGMSGTGKSSALAALERFGFQVTDTDEPGWTEWSDDEGGYVWCEARIEELLARDHGPSLYVSGTVSNQGRSARQNHGIKARAAHEHRRATRRVRSRVCRAGSSARAHSIWPVLVLVDH